MRQTIALLVLIGVLLPSGPLLAEGEVDRLVWELLSGDPDRMDRAFDALREMGPKAAPAIPHLVTLLTAPNEPDRFAAAKVLRAIGPERPEMTKLAAQLGRGLASENYVTRGGSAYVLGLIAFAPAAREKVPLVVPLLEDERELVQARAAGCLLAFRHEQERAIEVLIGLLGSDHTDVRRTAVSSGVFGKGCADATAEALAPALMDEDLEVRKKTAESIFVLVIDANSTAAFDALHDRVKDYDEDSYVRGVAARAIGLMGAKAKPAAGTLFEVSARHRTGFLARSAAGSIVILGRHAVPALRKALKDDEVSRRLAALRMLGAMEGEEAKSAVSAVAALLKDDNHEVRLEAVKLLIEMGTMARSARSALKKAARNDESEIIRRLADRALAGLSGR